jgi:hypothetical protein
MHNTLRFTAALQVYGGAVAFVIHPYVWSFSSFNGGSATSAGNTIVSGLSAVFTDCNFSGSKASTRTIGGITARSFFIVVVVHRRYSARHILDFRRERLSGFSI